MGQAVGEIVLDIVMGKNTISQSIRKSVSEANSVLTDASSTWSDKMGAVSNACTGVGAALTPVSAAVGAVAVKAGHAAMDFETALAKVKTLAGDTAVAYKGATMDMGAAIMQLSNDTGKAAGEVADATYQAISAGVDTADSVQFVSTANALAVGGFTDITTSVDVLTSAMNAYGGQLDQYGDTTGKATAISDKLITTQNLGKTTVDELGSSLGKILPSAAAYGVSIDNLCASYVELTKGGISTAESTTYMKSMLNELAKDGSKVSDVLKQQTGQSFSELMASGKSLGDVMAILGESVNGDSTAFANLWGSQEAGTGALAILNAGTQDYNDTMQQMAASTGAASDAMGTMGDTNAAKIGKALNALNNTGTTLAGTFLGAIAPAIEAVAGGIRTVCDVIQSLPGPVQVVIGVIVTVIALAGPVLMFVGSIAGAISSLIPIIGGIGAAVTGITLPAIGAAIAAAAPILLVIAAVAAAAWVLYTNWDTVCSLCTTAVDMFSQAFNDFCMWWTGIVTSTISAISDGFSAFCQWWTSLVQSVIEAVTGFFTGLADGVASIFSGIASTASTIWSGICDAVSGFVSALVSGVIGYYANLANTAASIFSGIASTASSIWSGICSTVSGIASSIYGAVSGAFNSMAGAVAGAVGNAANAIYSGFGAAADWLSGLASSAWSWGADMIQGFVNGITSSIGSVISAVSNVAGQVASLLHFSRPDTGPLREYEAWMPDMLAGLGSTFTANMGRLLDPAQELATGLAGAVQAPVIQSVAAGNAGPAPSGGGDSAGLADMLRQILAKGQDNDGQGGDIIIPVYIGNKQVDQVIVTAEERHKLRCGR